MSDNNPQEDSRTEEEKIEQEAFFFGEPLPSLHEVLIGCGFQFS